MMKKSFRCSYEINRFSSCFSDGAVKIESFERHEGIPQIISAESIEQMNEFVENMVCQYKTEGFQSIAIICKSMTGAEKLHKEIGSELGAALINTDSFGTINKVTILPVYMAKGLEFDAVLIYAANDEMYWDSEDRQLLYICCTRALHRLSIFYTGEKSRLIPLIEEVFQ
jgi:DNA helicase-2/ATP-dependent DNA helicase PcrA